eukprot:20843-Heterococcus_DN1.PRE.2
MCNVLLQVLPKRYHFTALQVVPRMHLLRLPHLLADTAPLELSCIHQLTQQQQQQQQQCNGNDTNKTAAAAATATGAQRFLQQWDAADALVVQLTSTADICSVENGGGTERSRTVPQEQSVGESNRLMIWHCLHSTDSSGGCSREWTASWLRQPDEFRYAYTTALCLLQRVRQAQVIARLPSVCTRCNTTVPLCVDKCSAAACAMQ